MKNYPVRYIILLIPVLFSVKASSQEYSGDMGKRIDDLRITDLEDLDDSVQALSMDLYHYESQIVTDTLSYIESILPEKAYRARLSVKHLKANFDYENRYRLLEKAYDYAQEHHIREFESDYYISKANWFYQDQAYDSAMVTILKARDLSLKRKNDKTEDILHLIGDVFYDLELYHNAETYYLQAMEIVNGYEKEDWRKTVLNYNLALINIEKKQFEEALRLFMQAYNYDVDHPVTYGDSLKKCYLNRKIAYCFLEMEAYPDSVRQMLEYSIAFSKRHKLQSHLLPSYISYIEFFMREDQRDSVDYHLTRFHSIYPENSFPDSYLGEYLLLKGKVYEYFGNTKKALSYKTRYIDLKDSARPNEKVANIMQMLTDQDYSMLEESYQMISRQKNILIIAFGFIFFLTVAIFISHRRTHNLNKELVESNRTKDKLFSIISHDLRSPIATYLSISELLEDSNRLDKERKTELETAQKDSIKTAFNLLENLLAWGKYNQHQISFNPSEIILSKHLESSLGFIKSAAQLKKINIVIDVARDIQVYADAEMLDFIFRNLGSNSLKFTESEGEIRVTAKTFSDHVEVHFSDTGIGMNEEEISKILDDEEYYTTKGTQNEAGSGLGLKIVKSFIESHNSRLRIESSIGKGSKFIFSLPLISDNTGE